MSTCIRGGSTYKRHKWEIRGVQLKWYKQCKHCHAERILDNGHWRPITMEESGWRNMPKVAKLRADGVLAEAEIIAIDEETTVSSHVAQEA